MSNEARKAAAQTIRDYAAQKSHQPRTPVTESRTRAQDRASKKAAVEALRTMTRNLEVPAQLDPGATRLTNTHTAKESHGDPSVTSAPWDSPEQLAED